MQMIKTVILALGFVTALGANAETIEVDIHGLTCAFCVDSLQRQLRKLPDIDQVDVSLKNKKVRIVSSAEKADIAVIKEAIIDSGFTPVQVRLVENE
jgi:copper chaperone CopZ